MEMPTKYSSLRQMKGDEEGVRAKFGNILKRNVVGEFTHSLISKRKTKNKRLLGK